MELRWGLKYIIGLQVENTTACWASIRQEKKGMKREKFEIVCLFRYTIEVKMRKRQGGTDTMSYETDCLMAELGKNLGELGIPLFTKYRDLQCASIHGQAAKLGCCYYQDGVYAVEASGGPAGAAGAATSDSGSRAAAYLSRMQKSWKTVGKAMRRRGK